MAQFGTDTDSGLLALVGDAFEVWNADFSHHNASLLSSLQETDLTAASVEQVSRTRSCVDHTKCLDKIITLIISYLFLIKQFIYLTIFNYKKAFNWLINSFN